jgi:hypothetical protein
VKIKTSVYWFFLFNLELSLLAPTKAKTTNDPGVTRVTAKAAESFNFFCLLVAVGIELFAIGYLRAPHDWHRGVSFSSLASQNEQLATAPP